MPPPHPTDLDPLGRAIGRTHKFVRAWADRELAELGSSVTEWIVLFHIADAPEPGASQTEIARYSDMGGPALVRHIDRLGAVREVMARCDEQLRSLLSPQEARVLTRALDKLFGFCLGEVTTRPVTPARTSA